MQLFTNIRRSLSPSKCKDFSPAEEEKKKSLSPDRLKRFGMSKLKRSGPEIQLEREIVFVANNSRKLINQVQPNKASIMKHLAFLVELHESLEKKMDVMLITKSDKLRTRSERNLFADPDRLITWKQTFLASQIQELKDNAVLHKRVSIDLQSEMLPKLLEIRESLPSDKDLLNTIETSQELVDKSEIRVRLIVSEIQQRLDMLSKPIDPAPK